MDIKVNLDVPLSWRNLTQGQLKYVFSLLAMNFSIDEIKTYCLFRWNKLEVIDKKPMGCDIRQGDNAFYVSAFIIQSATDALSYLEEFSEYPVCIHRIGKNKAVDATFDGVTFKKYLFCDNLYQGYLFTKDETLLEQMASVLYNNPDIIIKDSERIGVFYWWSSLKKYFSKEYPNFFKSVPASGDFNPKQVKEAMNTQIRALTKGDITKEKDILLSDTRRALTELDALAKEYADLERKYPKNGK